LLFHTATAAAVVVVPLATLLLLLLRSLSSHFPRHGWSVGCRLLLYRSSSSGSNTVKSIAIYGSSTAVFAVRSCFAMPPPPRASCLHFFCFLSSSSSENFVGGALVAFENGSFI